MGFIKHEVADILYKFFGRFRRFQSGAFTMGYGTDTITIPFRIPATHLWVSIDEDGEPDGCGQIPINTIGYILGDHEATFFLDIKTNICTIHWFAKS